MMKKLFEDKADFGINISITIHLTLLFPDYTDWAF
jgi:hypothetical protein